MMSGLRTIRPHYDQAMPTIERIWRATAVCTLALLMTNVGCGNIRTVQPAEYDVLSAFVNEQLAPSSGIGTDKTRSGENNQVVILSMSQSDDDARNSLYDSKGQRIPWPQYGITLQARFPALQRRTFDDFRERNRYQSRFQPSFHMTLPYELVARSEVNAIFKSGGWPAFYKRFPGSPGLIAFSRVGFSSDGMQAVFYASNSCGGLCGGGLYVVMEKRGGQWTIEKKIDTWVS